MKEILSSLLQGCLIVLAAEFFAGFAHWLEDAYIREDTPWVGKLVGRPNTLHHHFPRYMTRHNWLQSSWDLLLLATMLVGAAWAWGFLTWRVWLFAVLTTNANEFHKWTHRTRRENGWFISLLQDVRVLQTPQHHARHHTDPKNSHYCIITNVLNPVLDRVHFWDGLEWIVAKSLNIHRRPDTSIHGSSPGPDWLQDYQRRSIPAAGRRFRIPPAVAGQSKV